MAVTERENQDFNFETAKPQWYAVQTFTNYEKKIKQKIDMLTKKAEYKEKILRAEIPVQKRTVNKNGRIVEIEEKIFPGYVFIKMILDKNVWHAIKSINGVAGYVGPGGQPVPLTKEELVKIKIHDRGINVAEGDSVIITNGPFENFVGRVVEIRERDAGVVLSIFGRETKIYFSGEQLEKIQS
ncbi:MAG TPA: transcription termination/antitermination protein NusG [Clostridia bacterium]|nr:transcription termination/antitermination protein NusG [Clostridia bacterium]